MTRTPLTLRPMKRRHRRRSNAWWMNRGIWLAGAAVIGLILIAAMAAVPRIALPVFALVCGLLFLIYGLRYYISVAIIMLSTSGGNGNGNGNGDAGGLRALFNGNGLRNGQGGGNGAGNGLLNGFRRRNGNHLNGGNHGGNTGKLRLPPEKQPFISIQLPLYNEDRVVDRLLTACTNLDYENYEVLVADDSSDHTLNRIERWAKHPKVRVSHRINRTGFKGAALRHATEVMDRKADFVVVFDADFIPPPDILHQFLSYFYGINGTNGNGNGQNGDGLELVDKQLAVVQGYQWHVLNASENWITRGIRAEFSGSYVIERSWQELTGGMKMISGSVFMIRADILRKHKWGTSITEDWELTLRLYLDGYKVLYTPFIQAPAECVSDFKQLAKQRMRWAEGHTHNVKRFFGEVLRSPKLTRREKLEFLYYAPYYLTSVLFLLGTLAWMISELFLKFTLPFWTDVLGWSLVFTNAFALVLMNLAGLFQERGVQRSWVGLFSFTLLTFLLVPYQAYAAIKGLLEPHEGGWHRTRKSGVVTDVIRRMGLGRRMPKLLPKKKRRAVDLEKRLGLPISKLTQFVPSPLRRVSRRYRLATRVLAALITLLLLLAFLSSGISTVSAAPDTFYFRDTTTNGASPAGEDMNNVQGSSEDTILFDGTDDDIYWYTDLTYPTGGGDATLAAGAYALNMYFDQLPSNWWNTDYLYRQQITITAGSANVPTDYSVRIEFDHAALTTSKSQADGDDIRIVYWNGSGWTELDRRLDDQSSWDTSTTQVWFRTQAAINATQSDNNYYMYYGNSGAASPPTSWSNVFRFYDDFNDGSLDSGRWSCTRGTCTETSGTLTLNANSSIWADSSYAIGVNTRWEARIQLSNADASYYNYWGATDQDGFYGYYIIYWTDGSQHIAEHNGGSSNISPSTPTSYHNYIFDREGTSGVRYIQDSTQLANLTSGVPSGNLRAFAWVDAASRSETLDWVRVRNYVNPEPTTSFGSEVDAPFVEVVVSVYHTQGDGADAQAIVTSSATRIDANTADPYALPIGSGAEQTFTSSGPRRLRVLIDVTAVNGSASFTLAYDSAANPSSLDTPVLTVPDATLLLLAFVYLIPALTGFLTRKRKVTTRLISVGVALVVTMGLVGMQVLPASADVSETPNTFWFYDDAVPPEYYMYQTQPSGSTTSTLASETFLSDTFQNSWQINSGTSTVYFYAESGFSACDIDLTLRGGSTTLGTGTLSIPAYAAGYFSASFPTSQYTFSAGERLSLDVGPTCFGVPLSWDGIRNESRLETPTLVVHDWSMTFLLLAPLFPYLISTIWRRRRLAWPLISVLLAGAIAIGLLGLDINEVRAAPDTFYLHDTNTSGTSIAYDASSSSTALNTSSISWSHTIGSGNHRKLIVGVAIEEDVLGDEPVTGVTYNSVALTYASAVTAGTGPLMRVEVWYMDEANLPSTGTYTIQVNTTGTVQEMNAGGVSIAEARSGAPEATATNTNFNSASITTNITTLTNGAAVVDVVGSGNAGAFTPGSGQTEIWDVSASGATGALSGKLVATAGATSMQQTHSTTSNRNAHVVIAVAPHDPDKSPAGKYMNTTEGSGGSTMTFNTATQSAYWYVDETWPTGAGDATIAAGDYTFNMYFNQLPTWYDADWDCRKKITVNASQVPGDLTNFPVLVNLSSDTDLASDAQDDGDDILFTSSNGTTKISHEIERFNGTTGELVAWVEVPSVSGSSNTDIYMYYCNSSATNQQDVANTWDNGFVAVQHLHESSGTQSDSTGRGNSGTLNGTTTYDSNSKINGGRDFDGSSGYISIANSSDINTGGPYTDREISLWFNADTTSGRQVIFEEGAAIRGFSIYIDSGSLYVGGWNTPVGESNWAGTWHSTTISANTWYYVTLVLTGGTSTVQPNTFLAYLDGSSIGSGNGSQVWAHSGDIRMARSGANLLYHNGSSTAANYFDGTVDELRIANATRSANWIAASFNNQNSPSSFYTLNSEELEPTVNITVSVYHTKPDGTDPQAIVTSSSTEINTDTADPYALDIGTGLLQTFTASNPRRLRLHVYVDSVTGGGSFTLDYDGTCASSRCSNLDTPVVQVPEFAVALAPLVLILPLLAGTTRRRRRVSSITAHSQRKVRKV